MIFMKKDILLQFIKEEIEKAFLEEAKYQGKEVSLGKPSRTPSGPKKFSVYVKDGDKIKKVNFGSPDMEIKRDNPERRKSFRARHKCDTAKDRTTPRYWSCKMWSKTSVSSLTEALDNLDQD